MTNLEWMLNEIKSQVRGVRKQISGLPEEMRGPITDECVDILKRSEKAETPPSLDKDGCLYWDDVLANVRKG